MCCIIFFSHLTFLMGANVQYSCMKVKRSSTKASYTSKNAPLFCEILFVNKGKHVWTREASEGPSSLPPPLCPPETEHTERSRSKSPHSCSIEPDSTVDYLRSSPSTTSRLSSARNSLMTESDEREAKISPTESNFTDTFDPCDSRSSSCLTNSASALTSSTERKVSSEFNSKVEVMIIFSFLIDNGSHLCMIFLWRT